MTTRKSRRQVRRAGREAQAVEADEGLSVAGEARPPGEGAQDAAPVGEPAVRAEAGSGRTGDAGGRPTPEAKVAPDPASPDPAAPDPASPEAEAAPAHAGGRRRAGRAAATTGGRPRGHAFWRHAGRTCAGLVGIAAVGAVAAFGTTIAPAPVEAASPVQEMAVAPAQEVWACPGPARLTDPETVGDAAFGPSPVGTESSLRAAVGGGAVASGTTATVTDLDGGDPRELDTGEDAAVLTDGTVRAGSLLTVTPRADGAPVPGTAASIGSITTDGDLRGIAAATCVRPGISQWLVGGSTEVGSSTQLVLQNPGRTPATVKVEVWGPSGPVVLGSGSQHLVGPGQEVMALVEAAAPEQRRTVVHLTSTGGLVSAYLQHNTLDGLVPQGVDFVVPGSEPSTGLVVTGVQSTGEAVDDPHAPQLRLLAPGEERARVRLAVYGKDGVVHLRGAEEIDLEPGVVTDISLGGLPTGPYAVTVASDVPVVAGASEDRRGAPDPDLLREQPPYDRAWIAARAAPGAVGGPDTASVAADATATPPLADGAGGRHLGEVALVAGTSSTITVAAVPSPGADPAATSDERATFRGALRSYDDEGTLLGTLEVTVPIGTTFSVGATKITTSGSTARPAVVTLQRAGDSSSAQPDVSVSWSVLVTGGPPNGDEGSKAGSLVSVLLPAVGVPSGETVSVRETDAAGLE